MRRLIPFVFLVALFCVSTGLSGGAGAAADAAPSSEPTPSTRPSPAAGPRPTVEVIKVNGVIDAPMRDYLLGSLDQAEADGSTVVIQMNSPGSLGIDGAALADRIHDAKVPVIVWVGPAPAHAAGAAFAIAEGASIASMAPGSGIGPPTPGDLSDPEAGNWLREATAAEAVEDALIADLDPGEPTPGSITELLNQLDGTTVETADGPVVLDTGRATVRFHDLGPWRRVLHAVASPVAIYVLLLIGFAGIAFELTQPGFGFAGTCGVIALALAAYGLWIVPPNWFGLALLAGGTVLLMADVVLRRLGVLSWIGLTAFAAGSWLFYRGVAPAIDIPVWLMIAGTVSALLYYGFALTVAQQARDRIASTQQGLIGLVGETRGELDPEGGVHVKGALWRGRAVEGSGAIPAGTKVRVRGVDGLVLRVEPEVEED